MPQRKKNKRKNRARSKRSGSSIGGVDRTVTIPGKLLFEVNTGTTADFVLLPVDFNVDARLIALAGTFELYRFVSLNVRCYRGASENGPAEYVVSYHKLANPGALTLETAYVAPTSRYVSESITVPIPFKLSKPDLLHSNVPWWATGTLTSETVDLIQGYLHFQFTNIGATAQGATIELSYVVQFRSPVVANDAPLAFPTNPKVNPRTHCEFIVVSKPKI